jgi:hypothetical protein
MSLDRTKLQKLRDLGNGSCQAQCPACAEAGQDRTGEHLRISPEGKFGCCVFPGDRAHRQRIFALAGDHGPKAIRVRVASAKSAAPVQLDLLGRLGRVFSSLTEGQDNGTDTVGTLGTGTYSLRVEEKQLSIHKLIDNRTSVPNVPTDQACPQSETGVPSVPEIVRLPHLLSDGTLIIPFSAPERYYWWQGGQSVRRTMEELMERKEKYAAPF